MLSALRESRWRLSVFISLSAMLNYADRAALSAVVPPLRAEFVLSTVQIGLLSSIFLWVYALGSPLAGIACDRWPRRVIIVVSLVGWSVVTLLMGFATSYGQLLGLRVLLGAAECLFLPAAIVVLSEVHPMATRARALSFVTVGTSCGLVFGSAFAGYMADHFQWRSGFIALGVAGVALATLAGRVLPSAGESTSHKSAGRQWSAALRYLARTPTYYVLLAESTLSGLGLWMFFAWLPLYLRETYNLTLGTAGFAGTFMLQGALMLGIVCGGWLSDRLAANMPHLRMKLYSSFYLASAPFLMLFLAGLPFPALALAVGTFSFLRGMGQANDNPTQCEIVPLQYRSTGVGLMNACATGAGGCGVLLAAFLKDHLTLNAIFAAVSGLFVVAGIALWFGYRYHLARDIERARREPLIEATS